MLKLGSVGADVRTLQTLLKARGENITADGWFGQATHAALIRAQRALGLVVDGIAGPKTLAALESGNKAGKLLGLADLARAAQQLDVPLAAVRAINEVESRGAGFLADGRPVILFERHTMARRLREHGIDPAPHIARTPAIVNTQRGGYLGGTAEHRRLTMAREICEPAAIESASWGLFQIMGFHWRDLGYDSAEQFERFMQRSEGAQLDAFVRFIEANPHLHKALRAGKWAQFAAGYNGPDYKANLYDVKLARAFERYSAMESAA